MKSVNKTTVLNVASTVLLQGIAFFTTPIFTRMLGAEQYGVYSVFCSWITILSCILGLGVGSTLATGRYQFKNDYYGFRNGVLLFGTIISIIILGIGEIFIFPISSILGYTVYMTEFLYITAFSQYVINFAQNAFVYEKKAEKNFLLSVSLSTVSVGLSLVLISLYPRENRVLGRIVGVAIPYAIVAVIVWGLLYAKKPTGINKKYCAYGLSVGFPVIFHTLAQNILTQADRVMMQHMNIKNSEIGVYSLIYTLVSVMGIILNALNTSWCPFYYDDIDKKNWEELDRKCKNYIELFSVLTIGFLLLSREVSYVLGDSSYWKGINVIPILTMAVYFTFMYQFPVNFEFFYRKTKIIAIGTVGAAITNIILNALFIPIGGMYGAAIATALSYGMLFIVHYYIVTHMKECQYHLNYIIFIPGVMAVCIGIIAFYALSNYWYIRWGIGCVIGIIELLKIIKRKTIF